VKLPFIPSPPPLSLARPKFSQVIPFLLVLPSGLDVMGLFRVNVPRSSLPLPALFPEKLFPGLSMNFFPQLSDPPLPVNSPLLYAPESTFVPFPGIFFYSWRSLIPGGVFWASFSQDLLLPILAVLGKSFVSKRSKTELLLLFLLFRLIGSSFLDALGFINFSNFVPFLRPGIFPVFSGR